MDKTPDFKNVQPYEAPEPPQINATSDSEISIGVFPVNNVYSTQPLIKPIIKEYPAGSVLDMAYGAKDPSILASQAIQSGELFRVMRGFPYKRAGRNAPIFPVFKTTVLPIANLNSQPQANRSAAQITAPTADVNTTNTTIGTPHIGFPGFNKLNLV